MSSPARSDAPPPRRRRWLKALLVLAGVAGCIAIAALALKEKPERLDPALVVTATRAPLTVEVIDVGRVEAVEQVEIESKVPGRVTEVLVEPGQAVRAGDVLMRLDRRDFSRQVARERTLLAKAKALSAQATRERTRKRALAQAGLIAAAELEQAEHSHALAALEVRSARVTLLSARDRHADAEITSPISGTVIRRNIEPGEMVVPGVESTFERRALLSVADLSELEVLVELSQIDVAKVRLGQQVSLQLDALPSEKFAATVTEIAPASVRPAGRELDVFPVKALLSKADTRIRPGMTADVRIVIREKSSVVRLPVEAVVKKDQRCFVQRVIDDGEGQRTEQVSVELGVENDRWVEIRSGLAEGERVLIDPPSAQDNETKV